MAGAMSKQANQRKYPTRQHQQKPDRPGQELTKSAGDEVTFDLVNPVKSIPIMGDRWAQGKGSVITFAQDRLPDRQSSIPDQRRRRNVATAHAASKPARWRKMSRLSSPGDSLIRHLWSISPAHVDSTTTSSGACRLRRMPTSQKVMVSPSERQLVTDISSRPGRAWSRCQPAAIRSPTDVMNSDVVDGIATWLDGMALPLPGVEFENDEAAADSPVRVLMVSAERYNSFVRAPISGRCKHRVSLGRKWPKNHPVFLGDALLAGILILRCRGRSFSIREIRSSGRASTTSATETAGTICAPAQGICCVDRHFWPAEALAEGSGGTTEAGSSYFTAEERPTLAISVGTSLARSAGGRKSTF